ncbi:MAG TPA: hypothetical protein VJ898_05805 [Natrialbaceae archaeon]|nr:hypothetical protein [Natrialbaceae archaeon]
MKTRLLVTVAVATLVATAGLFVGAPGGNVSAASNASDGNASDGNETSMGAQISSFMGVSTAAANGSVENGMFSASFNATAVDDRPTVVENRTDVLERRLERLQTRKAALIANRENMTRAAYVARMSAVVGQIESLQRAINQTTTFARATGADPSRLAHLKSEARNLTGPEVARLARNGTVGVGNPGRGPPNGTPGEGPPNKTVEGPPNGTPGEGPPNKTGEGPPNGTPGEGTPNGTAGAGNGQGNGNGSGQGEGQDNDNGQGNDDRNQVESASRVRQMPLAPLFNS